MAVKKAKCENWPHPYDESGARGPDKCPLDRAQYLRESRRQQTTISQREGMRQAAHAGQDVTATEDQLDQG